MIDREVTTETTAETLADVLQELAELLPERFKLNNTGGAVDVVLGTGSMILILSDEGPIAGIYAALVIKACMEECEARGWHWFVSHYGRECDGDGYDAYLSRPMQQDDKTVWPVDPIHSADSAALALAMSLRYALQEGPYIGEIQEPF